MIDAATPESDKLASRLAGLCRPPGEGSEPDGVAGLARWLCANYSLYWRREDLHDPGALLLPVGDAVLAIAPNTCTSTRRMTHSRDVPRAPRAAASMEVGTLLLPPAMVADALTPEAMALLREPPLQLSFQAGMSTSFPPVIPAQALSPGRAAPERLPHIACTCSVTTGAAGVGQGEEGGAMREVLAAGEQLGAGSCTHGALWGVCAVAGEPIQLSMQVCCCLRITRRHRIT